MVGSISGGSYQAGSDGWHRNDGVDQEAGEGDDGDDGQGRRHHRTSWDRKE